MISPCRLGIALGIVWGLALALLALIAHMTPYYGHPFIQTLDSVYMGYSPTYEGAFLGFFWGFITFFVGAALVGWVYNLLSCKKESCR